MARTTASASTESGRRATHHFACRHGVGHRYCQFPRRWRATFATLFLIFFTRPTVAASPTPFAPEFIQTLLEVSGSQRLARHGEFAAYLRQRAITVELAFEIDPSRVLQAWSERIKSRRTLVRAVNEQTAALLGERRALSEVVRRLQKKWHGRAMSPAFARAQQAATDLAMSSQALRGATTELRVRMREVLGYQQDMRRAESLAREALRGLRIRHDEAMVEFRRGENGRREADGSVTVELARARRELLRARESERERLAGADAALAKDRDLYAVERKAFMANTAKLNQRIAAFNDAVNAHASEAPASELGAPELAPAQLDRDSEDIRTQRQHLEEVGRQLSDLAERIKRDQDLVMAEAQRSQHELNMLDAQIRAQETAVNDRQVAFDRDLDQRQHALRTELAVAQRKVEATLLEAVNQYRDKRAELERDYGTHYDALYERARRVLLADLSSDASAVDVIEARLGEDLRQFTYDVLRARSAQTQAREALADTDGAMLEDAQAFSVRADRQAAAREGLAERRDAQREAERKLGETWVSMRDDYIVLLEKFEHAEDDALRSFARLFKAREILTSLEFSALFSIFERTSDAAANHARYRQAARDWSTKTKALIAQESMSVPADFMSVSVLTDRLASYQQSDTESGRELGPRRWLELAVRVGALREVRTAWSALLSEYSKPSHITAVLERLAGDVLARNEVLSAEVNEWPIDVLMAGESYRLMADGQMSVLGHSDF